MRERLLERLAKLEIEIKNAISKASGNSPEPAILQERISPSNGTLDVRLDAINDSDG